VSYAGSGWLGRPFISPTVNIVLAFIISSLFASSSSRFSNGARNSLIDAASPRSCRIWTKLVATLRANKWAPCKRATRSALAKHPSTDSTLPPRAHNTCTSTRKLSASRQCCPQSSLAWRASTIAAAAKSNERYDPVLPPASRPRYPRQSWAAGIVRARARERRGWPQHRPNHLDQMYRSRPPITPTDAHTTSSSPTNR
jgi:hypothetical protein